MPFISMQNEKFWKIKNLVVDLNYFEIPIIHSFVSFHGINGN